MLHRVLDQSDTCVDLENYNWLPKYVAKRVLKIKELVLYGKVHVCQGSLLQVKVTVDNVKGWGCWAMGILA